MPDDMTDFCVIADYLLPFVLNIHMQIAGWCYSISIHLILHLYVFWVFLFLLVFCLFWIAGDSGCLSSTVKFTLHIIQKIIKNKQN